jgi:hypothetical protein
MAGESLSQPIDITLIETGHASPPAEHERNCSTTGDHSTSAAKDPGQPVGLAQEPLASRPAMIGLRFVERLLRRPFVDLSARLARLNLGRLGHSLEGADRPAPDPGS